MGQSQTLKDTGKAMVRGLKFMVFLLLLVMGFHAPVEAQTPAPTVRYAGSFGDKIYKFDWSPDGRSIVTGGFGLGWVVGEQINEDTLPTVQIWSVSVTDEGLQATVIHSIDDFDDGIRLVKWSPDGSKIAILENRADTLLMWDVQNQEFFEIPFINYRMHWNADSQSLIFAAQQVHIVDAQTGKEITTVPLPPEETPQTENPWWIIDAQVNPTGDVLVVIMPHQNCCYDQWYKFLIWNLENNGEPFIVDDIGGYEIVWSPDGRYLANQTGIFDTQTWEKVIDSSAFTFGFLHPSWSPDGRYLASHLGVFDTTTHQLLKLEGLDIDNFGATETAWSPRDNVVAVMRYNGVIDVWAVVP